MIEGYDDYQERINRGLLGYTWEGLIGRIDQLYKEVEEANARLAALDFRQGDADTLMELRTYLIEDRKIASTCQACRSLDRMIHMALKMEEKR
jgi:hypothetical protein